MRGRRLSRSGAQQPRSEQPASERKIPSLLRNTVAQSTPMLLGYFFSFVSAPIVLAGLGIRQFGIWALTGGIASYVALLEGFGPSLSRFIAANQADRRTCGQYVAIGFVSGTVVSAIALGAAIAGARALSLAVTGISTTDMRIVCVSAALILLSGFFVNVLCAYPVGQCRMVAPNVGLSIGSTLNFVASVGAIAFGASLPGYALANAGAELLAVFVVAALVLRSERGLPLARPELGRLTGFVTYSAKYQLVNLSALINYQTDKIVLGLSVGPSAAGAYELACRVAAAARELGVYPMTALLPTLTAEISRSGLESVRRRYARLAAVTATFAFPPLVLTAAGAPLLLAAWLAQVPPYSTAVLVVLTLAYIPIVSSGVGYVVSAAASDPGLGARAGAGMAVANVVLTVILVQQFRVWGVLAGTAIALIGGALALVLLVHRRFALPLRAYLDAVLPPLKICLVLALPVSAVAYSGIVHGRLMQACVLLVLAVIYFTVYATWAIRSHRVPVAIWELVLRVITPRSPAASLIGRLASWLGRVLGARTIVDRTD